MPNKVIMDGFSRHLKKTLLLIPGKWPVKLQTKDSPPPHFRFKTYCFTSSLGKKQLKNLFKNDRDVFKKVVFNW